ncbi:MAG TPA: PIN domain nuclease [Thermoanaerobaculia bacterium]|nr:PIN domain nuclease [Thermoanaerobaculia bacterium]
MLLVDSSVWVLVGRGRVDLDQRVPEEEIAICPPIFQEVLQGTSARTYGPTRLTLLEAVMLDAPVPFERYRYAVDLYLRCRAKAFTIRSSVDCLIAATAIQHNVQLLHDDRDFDYIAKVAPLKAVRV